MTAIESERIRDTLETMRHLAELHTADTVTTQDSKRTLAAIARASTDDARDMFKNCDESTHALIEESLWFDCGLRERGTRELLNPLGELVVEAAGFALLHLTADERIGGARSKGYQILTAQSAMRHWKLLGRGFVMRRSGWTGGANSLRRNPAARWVRAFLEIVEGRLFRPNEVDKVMRDLTR